MDRPVNEVKQDRTVAMNSEANDGTRKLAWPVSLAADTALELAVGVEGMKYRAPGALFIIDNHTAIGPRHDVARPAEHRFFAIAWHPEHFDCFERRPPRSVAIGRHSNRVAHCSNNGRVF
jgi:hypothetical protein